MATSNPSKIVSAPLELVWNKYRDYVRSHRDMVMNLESTIRTISYLLPGRYGDSSTRGEFIFAMSNIMGTLTDRAIGEDRTPTLYVGKETTFIRNLKDLIAIVQHLQLFLEELAESQLTHRNRWKLCLYIEIFKAMCRLYLLYYFQGHMLMIPTEAEIKHNAKLKAADTSGKYTNLQMMYLGHGRGPHPHGHFSPMSATLRQPQQPQKALTGHPPSNEDEKSSDATTTAVLPAQTESGMSNGVSTASDELANGGVSSSMASPDRNSYFQTTLQRAKSVKILAEILHIVRPVVFCGLRLRCNIDNTQWTPFIASFLLDIYSFMLHRAGKANERQREELQRRSMLWLFYLLRPPFFNRYIGNPMNSVTESLQKRNSRVRYWIMSMLSQLLLSYQAYYFNTCGSNY